MEIANLRHFKKEVEEIKEGAECGIIFFRYNEFEEGDTLVAYEKVWFIHRYYLLYSMIYLYYVLIGDLIL